MKNIQKIFKNYGLSITLITFFILSWAGQSYYQWQEYVKEQETHQQSATVEDFAPVFWSATLENWQSEFLQLFTMVVLTSFLSHKGSPESKDSEEKTEASLKRIEALLKKKR
jgi:hypothetical protein